MELTVEGSTRNDHSTTDMISPTSIQTLRTVDYVKPAKSRVMRRMLVIWGFALALFSSFGPRAYNEKYVYDVFIDGTPVGSYNVDRTELNGEMGDLMEDGATANGF
jgi:hypothetical protein